MTTPIVLFLLFGALFGLATFAHRHLFSEGPTTRDDAGTSGRLGARLGWALLCSTLWPLMALTGLHSVWLLARRRRRLARVSGSSDGPAGAAAAPADRGPAQPAAASLAAAPRTR